MFSEDEKLAKFGIILSRTTKSCVCGSKVSSSPVPRLAEKAVRILSMKANCSFLP